MLVRMGVKLMVLSYTLAVLKGTYSFRVTWVEIPVLFENTLQL